MKNVQLLDCTLRDGGYINDWNWGYENTKDIIKTLVKADIDVVEVGFLRNIEKYDSNITVSLSVLLFSSITMFVESSELPIIATVLSSVAFGWKRLCLFEQLTINAQNTMIRMILPAFIVRLFYFKLCIHVYFQLQSYLVFVGR